VLPTPVQTAAGSPPTRADWVDAMLRRAILSGELAPGEKLLGEKLAQQWGVSATPLRESFRRLAGEGLVVIEPQRGARVAPISVDDAAEIYEIRLLLDPVALRASIDAAAASGDETYASSVEAAHRDLQRRRRSIAEVRLAHRTFHLALVARCPNGLLLRQVEHLLDQSQRFQAVAGAVKSLGDAEVEHRALSDAAIDGDADRAVAVLTAHLEGTLAAVRSVAR
jgi:GntR family carbon starvation induced transcriptional regulator